MTTDLTPTALATLQESIRFVETSLAAVKNQDLDLFSQLLASSQQNSILNWFRTAFLLYIAESQFPDAYQQAIGEEMFSFSTQETSRRLLIMRHYPVEHTPLLNPNYANVSPSYYETARGYGLDTQPVALSLHLIDYAIEHRLSRDDFRTHCRETATRLGLSTPPQRETVLRIEPLLSDHEIADRIRTRYGSQRAQAIANALITTIQAYEKDNSPLDNAT